jgi:hypothetical protein
MRHSAYIIGILVFFVLSGCSDSGSPGISDPEDLVGTWIVNKFEKDGNELDFTDGQFQFTATQFSGWVEGVEGMEDGTFAGEYTADENQIIMDITVTDNNAIMDMGGQVWEYRADPSRAKIWYDNSHGYKITIKLEK